MQQELTDLIGKINDDYLWFYIGLPVLILFGVYFSIRTNFVQFRMLREMVRVIFEKNDNKKGVTPFQAFCISMAARVGTGNIAGIALAIGIGGPGAVFWMWIVAIFGSATGFIENTLAQIYKIKDGDGYRGGPAYYMRQGLNSRWMSVLFSVLIIITFGLVFNSVQSNTIAEVFNDKFGIDRTLIGLVIAFLFALIIFGGVKRIAVATEKFVIIKAGTYLLLGLIVIVTHISDMPSVFALIFEHAFGLKEIAGGTFGGMILIGVKRGLFSNEAGLGSAPNAAATAETSHPVKQGLLQAFGVLTDTLLICTTTAIIVLLSDAWKTGEANGINLTRTSITAELGEWAGLLLTILVFLFAFSTLIGNYYYGETNIEFLKKSKPLLYVYRFAVLAMIVFGSTAKMLLVWSLADLFSCLMALVNLAAVLLLSNKAIAALKDYQRQKKAGKNPVFYRDSIPGLENVECWERPAGSKEKTV